MNNILTLFKIQSELKKEIKKIDPDCKIRYNLSKDDSGEYDKESNTITISLSSIFHFSETPPRIKIDFSNHALAEVVFSGFHERRHLIDFKLKEEKDVSEHILMEKLAFCNTPSLYREHYYGEIWYEQRAICDGYISGVDFLKKHLPTLDAEALAVSSVEFRKDVKNFITGKFRYPFLREAFSSDFQTMEFNFQQTMEKIPSKKFSYLKKESKLGGYKKEIFSLHDFSKIKKFGIFPDAKSSLKKSSMLNKLRSQDFYENVYTPFDDSCREDQLKQLIELNSKSYNFAHLVLTELKHPKEVLEIYDRDKRFSDILDFIKPEPEPDKSSGGRF